MTYFSNPWKSAKRFFLLALFFAAAPGATAEPPPHGLASLAPNLTELVCALGFRTQLVARSSACDFPPDVKMLPVAGDFGRPNLEALARLRPKLVLVSDVENPEVLEGIRQTGAACLHLSCESWTGLLAAADAICAQLGAPQRAAAWKTNMIARRAALAARVNAAWRGKKRPRVFIEIWDDPLTTAGGESFLDDLVTLAGGTNIAHNLSPAYVHVDDEWVIRENPDIILAPRNSAGDDLAKMIRSRDGWQDIAAVKNGAICSSIPPALLLRSGPRCIEGAEQFATWLMKDFQPAKNTKGTKSTTNEHPSIRI